MENFGMVIIGLKKKRKLKPTVNFGYLKLKEIYKGTNKTINYYSIMVGT
jgi:hypothetical protein